MKDLNECIVHHPSFSGVCLFDILSDDNIVAVLFDKNFK